MKSMNPFLSSHWMKTYKEILSEYIPLNTISFVLEWLEKSNVQIRITKSRTSKLGDYRPPLNKKFHRISVNHNLNKYHFLITLVHEYAHLKNWEINKRNVKPHGVEWQKYFSELMQPFLEAEIFPADFKPIIIQYLKNPNASSLNTRLVLKLREYDKVKDYLTLQDLPFNSFFRIYNGIVFEKLEKMQKRFKCRRIDNNRIYMVSPIIEVVPVTTK
jgi:SprT protein